MEILIVDPDENLDDWYYNSLKELYINRRDIFFCRNMQEAQDFVTENLIRQQRHLDLIITDSFTSAYQEDLTTAEFVEWIRKNEETFSFSNFKISSLPIIIFSQALDAVTFGKWEYVSHVPKEIIDQFAVLVPPSKSAVKAWRSDVLKDLDVLGIGVDVNPGNIQVGYTVKVRKDSTKILSYKYILTQTPLPYLWLRKELFQLEQSIEELEFLIKDYLNKTREQLKRSDWEKQFQEFFKRNPKFLFGNNYSKFWSEPALTDSFRKKTYKPDLVKKPLISPDIGKNWEILDLKTPLASFMQQSNFHPIFTEKFNKCIKQVRDYYTFFNDDHNREILEQKFSFHPKNPRCSLIIGKRDLFYKDQDLIYKNLNEINASFINIITYDEIVEHQKVELEQLLQLRVF
jgi:hypothetical protein